METRMFKLVQLLLAVVVLVVAVVLAAGGADDTDARTALYIVLVVAGVSLIGLLFQNWWLADGENTEQDQQQRMEEGVRAKKATTTTTTTTTNKQTATLVDIEELPVQSLTFATVATDLLSTRKVESAPLVSCLQLFKIGVGPSSSHTVGPMKAAASFVRELEINEQLSKVSEVKVDLYGSLALTGVGHGTDKAILIGLLGQEPETCDPAEVEGEVKEIREKSVIQLLRKHPIPFSKSHVKFRMTEFLPFHSNAFMITAKNESSEVIMKKTYYSVGGGFVVDHDFISSDQTQTGDKIQVPYPFYTAEELLTICRRTGKRIPEVVWANECAWRPEEETRSKVIGIWRVMQECVRRGLRTTGQLEGFHVKRRASNLFTALKKVDRIHREMTIVTEEQSVDMERLEIEGDCVERSSNHGNEMENGSEEQIQTESATGRNSDAMEHQLAGGEFLKWLSMYALAVSEENAAGGRVVTAPTNGAAGIIPAVLHYFTEHHKHTEQQIIDFFMTATAIGFLFKHNASISGAEAGCQGEVGVASSMAAAGLTAVLGGSNAEIENAAEIAMEHHLGMTCDPVGGLVQVPCIERNTMGAVKAVNATVLALQSHGDHVVSLDKVIRAMKRTGDDMQDKYKETSQGGLALEFENMFKESVAHPVC